MTGARRARTIVTGATRRSGPRHERSRTRRPTASHPRSRSARRSRIGRAGKPRRLERRRNRSRRRSPDPRSARRRRIARMATHSIPIIRTATRRATGPPRLPGRALPVSPTMTTSPRSWRFRRAAVASLDRSPTVSRAARRRLGTRLCWSWPPHRRTSQPPGRLWKTWTMAMGLRLLNRTGVEPRRAPENVTAPSTASGHRGNVHIDAKPSRRSGPGWAWPVCRCRRCCSASPPS